MANLFTSRISRFWFFAVLASAVADFVGGSVERLLRANEFAGQVDFRYPFVDSPRALAEFLALTTIGGLIVALGGVVAYVASKRARSIGFIACVALAPILWDVAMAVGRVFFNSLTYVESGNAISLADSIEMIYSRALDPDRFWVIGAAIYGLITTSAGMLLARRYGANAPRADSAPTPVVERVRSRARLRDRLPKFLHRFIPAVP